MNEMTDEEIEHNATIMAENFLAGRELFHGLPERAKKARNEIKNMVGYAKKRESQGLDPFEGLDFTEKETN